MSDFKNEAARLAAKAVTMLKERPGGQLDYSEASLQSVEDALSECAECDIPERMKKQLVQEFGCYILEVARKKFGGDYQWHEQRDQPVLVVGEPACHIAIMTWDKVRSRLDGDEADNIPFFYAGFSEKVRNAAPGTRTLYV
ncbi:MAG TPA: hypothetical protein VGH19_04125 [Verrucomicrobiae bacterium]